MNIFLARLIKDGNAASPSKPWARPHRPAGERHPSPDESPSRKFGDPPKSHANMDGRPFGVGL